MKLLNILAMLLLFVSAQSFGSVNTWRLVESIKATNSEVSTFQAAKIAAAILTESNQTSVSVRTLYGVLKKESGFNAKAVNPRSGALGLGQILPQYHQKRMADLGVKSLTNPADNVRVTANIIAEYQRRFGQKWIVFYSGNGTEARAARYRRDVSRFEREL